MKQILSVDLIDRNKGQIDGVHGNPRFIKDAEFDKLVKSIREDASFLDHRGLLVFPHKGRFVTIGGNMRFEACKASGMTEVTCEILPEDTPAKKLNDYIILDNASFGQWNFEELANFDADILERYNIEIPQIDLTPEDEPTEAEEDHYEIPDEVKTDIKLGDLFEIKCNGLTHRLICGDSTNAEHVDKLMDGKKADALITDPPYNVDYQGGTAAKLKIENDKMSDENFYQFLSDAFKQAARVMKPGAAFYVYHATREAVNFITALRNNGLTDRQQLIWVKSSLVIGRQDYQWRHEAILYGWKDGAAHYFINNRSLTTVIEDQIDVEKLTKAEMRDLLKEMLSDTETPQTIIREDKPLRNGEHPTMKPVKLIGRNVYNSTRIYETVLDLFMGSGSTLIAAHQLKRNCYGAELDPKYCQVILDRFRKLEPECEIKRIEDNDTKTTN